MKRSAVVREIRPVTERPAPAIKAVPAPRPARPALTTARVHEVREADVLLEFSGEVVPAKIDVSVSRVVLEGARERGERVVVEQDGDELVVIGALRAQPTPGVDAADEYTIKAKRLKLEAGQELSLCAQTAALVLRAAGEVETFAERIISRAEGVHKIIGRMLRLN